jgi:hypothetical protein
MLSAAEQLIGAGDGDPRLAFGLVMAAGVIAATEPLPAPRQAGPPPAP